MSTAVDRPRESWHGVEMSIEEFLALPEDGVHRELIKGTVREERDKHKAAAGVTLNLAR